ncbi:MAG: hypothetical protein LBB74_07500 [Chitinispirillales bacterium]|jgi:hypothetical protein|nr:hypothetical protein [Chitinispirillales bacterium]
MHAFSSFFHHVRTVAVGSAVVGVTSARRARRIVNTVKVCALCAAVSAATVFADTIELLSGGPITGARVVEKTSAEVRFYVAGKDILYMVGRPQVSRIVYDNGAVEDFRGAPATPPPAPVPPPQPAYAPPQPEYAPPVAQQPQITPPPDSRASAATYSNSDAFSNDAAEEGRGGGG